MFQLSLRWLLVLVALVAFAIVSLRMASAGWVTAVSTVVLLAFWATVIIAVVDRGERQVFAIGFALSIALYGVLLVSVPREGHANWMEHPEFNPDTGRLPTTRLLAPLFHATATLTWYDTSTGTILRNYDFNKATSGGMGANVSLTETPDRWTFTVIGHLWWAVILGLCGGWFARFVYLRRVRRDASLASGRS